MNEARKQMLLETLQRLKEREQELSDLSSAIEDHLIDLPETKVFKDLRKAYSRTTESLDEARDCLESAIDEIETEFFPKPTHYPMSWLGWIFIVPGICLVLLAIVFLIIGSAGGFYDWTTIVVSLLYGIPAIVIPLIIHALVNRPSRETTVSWTSRGSDDSLETHAATIVTGALFSSGLKHSDDNTREDIYASQDENLAILEDMQQMHNANPDADLDAHFGWDHKVDYDSDDVEDSWF